MGIPPIHWLNVLGLVDTHIKHFFICFLCVTKSVYNTHVLLLLLSNACTVSRPSLPWQQEGWGCSRRGHSQDS